MVALATPDRGDLVWLEFSPQAGHEQAGRRPALVLSPRSYNKKSGLALMCPVTSRAKGYPFEVAIPDESEINGVVLADQVRSLDWRARHARIVSKMPPDEISRVIALIEALLGKI